MVRLFVYFFIFAYVAVTINSAPVDNIEAPKDSKSVFNPPFDEIVVESSLTVKRKSANPKQSKPRQLTANPEAESKRTKRNFPMRLNNFNGGASQANAQAQNFNANGPLGAFGASSTGANTQGLQYNGNGFTGASGMSGTQQYRLPTGDTIDVNFNQALSFGSTGNLAGAGTSSVTLSGKNGNKRQFRP